MPVPGVGPGLLVFAWLVRVQELLPPAASGIGGLQVLTVSMKLLGTASVAEQVVPPAPMLLTTKVAGLPGAAKPMPPFETIAPPVQTTVTTTAGPVVPTYTLLTLKVAGTWGAIPGAAQPLLKISCPVAVQFRPGKLS